MTDFVGVAADDILNLDAYYRVVLEENVWPGLSGVLRGVFQNRVNAVYNNMYARTGVLSPVVPNPVKSGDTATNYVIDVGLINSGDASSITAREAVRRIEGIAGGGLTEVAYDVRSFTALASVTDVRDGNAARDNLQAQVTQQKEQESSLNTIGHWLTLVVVVVVALAAIQISKDL